MSVPLLFGKLPARADFVRRGPTSPAADAFDTLVQRALRDRDRPQGPLYRMVLAPPQASDAVVGAVAMSHDAVGRAYPLVVGRTVPRADLDPASAAAWPLRWAELVGASAGLVDGARRGLPLDDVGHRLDDLPALSPSTGRSEHVDTHVRALAAMPARALWQRLWGSTDAGRAACLLRKLSQSPRGPVTYGLRFPLPPPAPDFRRSDAVAVWLAVCAHLLPRPAAPPSLFWTDGPPGALLVFFGAISPGALRALLAGRPTDRIAAVDAGPETDEARALAALPATARRALGADRASLADVLASLHSLR
ncbi:type VI secretion system-associated protein TagF [Rubrivirga sp. IMCC43871]|uniref:type VI secretion system-associated protein TagF n=1 Tax=Rubrivirga sp. IMCC43871 TaxID=3391575 RepID=UPI00398FBF10